VWACSEEYEVVVDWCQGLQCPLPPILPIRPLLVLFVCSLHPPILHTLLPFMNMASTLRPFFHCHLCHVNHCSDQCSWSCHCSCCWIRLGLMLGWSGTKIIVQNKGSSSISSLTSTDVCSYFVSLMGWEDTNVSLVSQCIDRVVYYWTCSVGQKNIGRQGEEDPYLTMYNSVGITRPNLHPANRLAYMAKWVLVKFCELVFES